MKLPQNYNRIPLSHIPISVVVKADMPIFADPAAQTLDRQVDGCVQHHQKHKRDHTWKKMDSWIDG